LTLLYLKARNEINYKKLQYEDSRLFLERKRVHFN